MTDVSEPDRKLLAALVSGNGRGHLLAERLLARFGSLAAIGRAHPADLTLVDGIGPATAARLVASFELSRRADAGEPPRKIHSHEDIVRVVAPLLWARTRERAVVMSCARSLRVLGCDVLSEGSADRALMPPREAMVAVLRREGQAFAVAHNHPSDDPTPSADDIEATSRMQRAADALGLRFLGHVVVTDTGWQAVRTSLSGLSSTRPARSRTHQMKARPTWQRS